MSNSDIIAIFAIVERGKADYVVERAKKVGAGGATILYGRGTGQSEIKKFLKMHIESSKEVVVILVERNKYKKIFDEIVDAGKLKEPGVGIVFSFPVLDLVGLRHRKSFEF